MRSFHRLVFDDSVEGTTAVYTAPEWNGLLAMTTALEIMAIVTQVGGTTPTLTVASQIGPDNRNWIDRLPTPEIDAAALSTTAQTIAAGKSAADEFTSGFVRMKITLGGTDTLKARVQLFVTGRGEQVLE